MKGIVPGLESSLIRIILLSDGTLSLSIKSSSQQIKIILPNIIIDIPELLSTSSGIICVSI